MAVTTPGADALISFSIFIASSTRTPCPGATGLPHRRQDPEHQARHRRPDDTPLRGRFGLPDQALNVARPLIQHRRVGPLPPGRHRPAPGSQALERHQQGPAIDRDLAQRSSRDGRLAHCDRPSVYRDPLTVDDHLELPAANRHEVLHARSRTATVSTCAVWGKRSKALEVGEPPALAQAPEIAPERGRIAGDVDEATRGRGADRLHDARIHAGPRRVGDHEIGRSHRVDDILHLRGVRTQVTPSPRSTRRDEPPSTSDSTLSTRAPRSSSIRLVSPIPA